MTFVRFLGYDKSQTRLPSVLEGKGHVVEQTSEPLSNLGDADVNISFGYRHILPPTVLKTSKRPVLNLHIGYLPYNRGAHPNFWAFHDNTPSGVTIHEIDEGVDTGSICFQRYVNFAPDETTFAATHKRLLREIEDLFVEHLDVLIAGRYQARPQRGAGTVHRQSQLPTIESWDLPIDAVLARLDKDSRTKRDLALVDEIQSVRTKNNVNWMDLLRIALKASPAETKSVLRKINSDDNRISELFRKLSEE
jgi:methionyl-tRNA formyltransferase